MIIENDRSRQVTVHGTGFRHPCRYDGFFSSATSLFVLFCLLYLITFPLQAAVIKATPDRDPVGMNETFNLVFSSEGSVDDNPDFDPLSKDFEILGQNQNSQFSIANGKMSRVQEWTLTLSPKRTGAIPIPSIAFGKDRSQPGAVTVIEPGAASPSKPRGTTDEEEIKLEVEAVPKNPYVQAQVIYTVRVLLRVNLAGADLSEPVAQDALIERLGDDHRYSTSRNGRDYTVIERKYALFPQKSGLLRVDPMRLTAQVEVGGRSFFAPSTRAIQVKSEAIDLQVRPIPAAFTGKHWLPAADLKLEQSWPKNPPQAKAGEPITRTLSLIATGATKGLIPELGADLMLDPTIKQYPDQPSLTEEKQPSTGITSTRQEKTALIPSRPGKFKLPAVEIPWWNTKADKLEIARVPELTLNVEASGETSGQTAPTAPVPQTAEELSSVPVGKSNVPLKDWENVWFWLALFLGVGWLVTGLAWWMSLRKDRPGFQNRDGLLAGKLPASMSRQAQSDQSPGLSQARKALRLACSKNDPAAARTALLHWASVYWPDRRPTSLDEIASLGGAALAEETGRINRIVYGNAGDAWNGDALWAVVESLDGGENQKHQQVGLEPLYR